MTPDRTPDTLAVALHFASILDHLSIPYVVGGSIASSVHGEPRSTHDVDFVADLTVGQVEGLVERLKPTYYVDAGTAREAVTAGRSFNAIHLATAVKVDVFVAGGDAFDLERIRCASAVRVGPANTDRLKLDTPEYTVLRKLEWYRQGGEVSERQWRDAASIVRSQGRTFDRERMETWAERLGVVDLLDRLLEEGTS